MQEYSTYMNDEPAIIIDQQPQQQHEEEQDQHEQQETLPQLQDHQEEQQEDIMASDGVFSNVSQGLSGPYRNMMMAYWQETINSIEHDEHDFKNHQLPLARIKKVMKTDEEVRMISAEAPILFAKGCDIFITELTMRAWIHAEENKRRTLQKSDIAAALQKSDMFDFLIDIVPREEDKGSKRPTGGSSSSRQGSYYKTADQLQQEQQTVQDQQLPQQEHEQGSHHPPHHSTQEYNENNGNFEYNELNYEKDIDFV